MRNHTVSALRTARRLRKDMSLPEVLLWRSLRTRPKGFKFRKQHPIGNFIADFYCDAAKMVIEVDGIVHDMGDRPDRDIERDAALRARGFRVVRIPAGEVLDDPVGIAEAIAATCATPPPSAAFAAATSPEGGGS